MWHKHHVQQQKQLLSSIKRKHKHLLQRISTQLYPHHGGRHVTFLVGGPGREVLDRMACDNVSVDGALVERFTDVSGWTNDTYTIPVLRGGRVVNITKDCYSDGRTINICEVQVWECLDGWYGTGCSHTCGNCITNSDCDKTTGQCTSCKTGFSLPNCTDCENGWYGNNCVETCGHCMGGNSTCNRINGSCPSCDGAFTPPLCKDNCETGWYGHNCVETCGHCMGGNSTCDKINGSCPSCDGAFTPPLCKDYLSSKFPMTTSNTSSSIQAGMSCDNDKETVSVAGPVAGAAVGCSVVFFIVGAVFSWWLRKSRSQQPSATGSSPYEIPIISDSGTARPTSRPNEKVDTTPDYTNIGYTTNVYEALKAPDDNNTTPYTSLDFHTQSDVH
ncbi:multiple epidermal growth factor-like domains protein 10 isoform X2 [Pomacea canaliculata]|uniref:multiple epidermal growth factor-like domains protein 10 isoform X2 n=1 Tax=Pomacea canaliculata TaxID=400727 RepID=UPI000D732350|nr:multiple epidermal growth factor-like domains protein 10 isoform X2 [Pomacea canaliculata]